MIDRRFPRRAGAVALVAVCLLLGASLAPSGAEVGPEASYDALQPLFERGAAKGDDDGAIEVYQFHQPDPSAWIWIRPNPQTGDREVTWIKHDSWVDPTPGNPIPTDYVPVGDPVPAELQALLDWIVQQYWHVESIDELTVVG